MTFDHPIDENTSTLVEVLVAAREYCLFGPHKINPLSRLIIGHYQIGQGIKWHGTLSEFESYAAGIIHLLGGCEQIVDHRKTKNDAYSLLHGHTFLSHTKVVQLNFRKVFEQYSMIFQNAHYFCNSSTSGTRASRYNEKELVTTICKLCICLLNAIPKKNRSEAFVTAWNIMNGVL